MDINQFYYYGENDQGKEVEGDLELNLLTPSRSMFYFREYGSDLAEFENKPMSPITQMLLAYNVVRAVANMNTHTSDGSGNTRDRRVLTSQSQVSVEPTNNRNNKDLNVSVGYIPMFNTDRRGQLDLSLGGL